MGTAHVRKSESREAKHLRMRHADGSANATARRRSHTLAYVGSKVWTRDPCRIQGLLKRRGHLLMNGVLGMTHWDTKAGRFNCVTLTKESLEKVLRDCGFLDLEWTIVDREYFHSVSDYAKSFLLLARKP